MITNKGRKHCQQWRDHCGENERWCRNVKVDDGAPVRDFRRPSKFLKF
jgi:hypothetical protein